MHSLFHCDFAQQAWKDAIFPNLFLCDCVLIIVGVFLSMLFPPYLALNYACW